MKILYVITGLGLGGAEKVVVDLAEQMANKGHDVKIVYLKGEAVVKPQLNQIEVIYLGLELLINFFSASRKYKKLIKQYQPDIVHAHMVHANIFARLNRIGCYIPKLICTAHSSNEGGKLRMLAYRYTNFLSDLNTNVSQSAANALIERGAFNKNNLIHIYNGVNLEKFKPNKIVRNNSHIIQFLSVGRFNEAKDYPNLLHAIALIINKNTNIHFNIAGDGALRNEIETLIKKWHLQSFVTLLGKRDDIPELINQADFFVLPSVYEGFGLVVAEAMACETFVIATDCGGVKEVMGGYGFLVPPKNSELLANALEDAINMEPEDIIENNKKARNYIQKTFDRDNITDQWLKIYSAENRGSQ